MKTEIEKSGKAKIILSIWFQIKNTDLVTVAITLTSTLHILARWELSQPETNFPLVDELLFLGVLANKQLEILRG